MVMYIAIAHGGAAISGGYQWIPTQVA